MKVYLAEEVRESIATRMIPLEVIRKDLDFAVDMMLHGASAFEIVQCKNCKHCSEYYDRDGYPYWMCDEWDSGTDADGFCHYGKRKGGAE